MGAVRWHQVKVVADSRSIMSGQGNAQRDGMWWRNGSDRSRFVCVYLSIYVLILNLCIWLFLLNYMILYIYIKIVINIYIYIIFKLYIIIHNFSLFGKQLPFEQKTHTFPCRCTTIYTYIPYLIISTFVSLRWHVFPHPPGQQLGTLRAWPCRGGVWWTAKPGGHAGDIFLEHLYESTDDNNPTK